MPENKEEDLRKLRAADPDTVVSNTIQTEANKQIDNLSSFEKVNLAGDAINEEIDIAVDSGRLSVEDAAESKQAINDPKKHRELEKGTGVKSDFIKAMGFFAPQVLGLAVGGLLGGTEGAIQGSEQGAALGQGFRDFSRQERLDAQAAEDRDAQNKLKLTDQELRQQSIDSKNAEQGKFKTNLNLVHATTGETLSTRNGKVFTQSGEVVPPSQQLNLASAKVDQRNVSLNLSEDRLNNSRVKTAQASERLNLSERRLENKLEEQDELSGPQVEEINGFDIAISNANNILDLANSSTLQIGPFRGRFESAKATLGVGDPDFIAFQQEIRSNLAGAVKAASGTAASDTERDFIASFNPSENDTVAQVKVKAKGLKTYMNRQRKVKLDNFRKFQGKKIKGTSQPNTVQVPAPPVTGSTFLDRIKAIKAKRGNK